MLEKVLLATNFHGKLHKLSLETLECDIVDNILQISKVNGFKRIVTTPTCAWAVCADQNIYFCVLETDLPIKVGESCYENERWSMSYGWSEKSLLFSDRWHWSSKDGKNERKPELINLPSEDWCWEGNWIVDKSINCDSEGWQYAFDFPAKYHSEPGKISFVRRRKWIRYRKFISYNKWSALTEGFVAEKSTKNINAIPEINAPEDLYQDISVGGFQLQGQQPGYLAVWAITFSGRVLYRAGITRTCPQGELWLEVKSDNINFLQISVGPDGHLWGCTWDGYAVVRQGVSHKCQIGTSWREVDCPKGEEFQQVAVGKNVVWGLSKNKKIFFRGGLTNKNEIGEKWIEMIGVFSFVNIGPNNQVFALSEDGHNIYVRTNVTPDELVGREWKLIKFSKSASTWRSFDSGACNIDSAIVDSLKSVNISQSSSISSLATAGGDWRTDLLYQLNERNRREMCNFGELAINYKDKSWNKKEQGYLLIDSNDSNVWIKCSLLYKPDTLSDNSSYNIFIHYQQKNESQEIRLPKNMIKCAHRIKESTHLNSFSIQTHENNYFVISLETEALLIEWLSCLNFSLHNILDVNIWSTSTLGEIFVCAGSQPDFSDLQTQKWLSVPGQVSRVISGVDGMIWALGNDGHAYSYSPNQLFEQRLVEEHFIYENKRWNPIEGYSDRFLPSDRWHWSDESGVYDCSKDKYRLPTKSSKWLNEWEIDYSHEVDEMGWQYAVDFPRHYHSYKGINDYVRRRRWKRLCLITTHGPWKEVPTDATIRDLSINMQQLSCCIWAVSCHGDVMVRSGITKENPQGDSWQIVLIDIPAVCISVGVNSKVWCVAEDGSCFFRAGFHENSALGTHWIHILKEGFIIRSISAGATVVVVLDNTASMYYRANVSEIYPEGTAWVKVLDNVTSVSVNQNDQIVVVQNGTLKIVEGQINGQFKLTDVLMNDWNSVCIRSIPKIKSVDDDTDYRTDSPSHLNKEITTPANNALDNTYETYSEETTERIDPYSVDIYSFYKSAK